MIITKEHNACFKKLVNQLLCYHQHNKMLNVMHLCYLVFKTLEFKKSFCKGSSSILISFMNTSYVFSFSKNYSMFNSSSTLLPWWVMKKKKQLNDLSKLTFTRWGLFFKHLQNKIKILIECYN
jgi:hypothetical protein